MESTLLTIDCGTQSLRGLLFSTQGDLIDKAQIHYEPYFSTHPGWAEQDPEIFWNSVVEACVLLQRTSPVAFKAVKGVGVTTQRASMVNVDKNGIPLRPVITWLDQRAANEIYSPNFLMRSILKGIGIDAAFTKLQKDGKCNWIRQNQPEIWEQTHKYLQVSGFLNYRLTGRFKDSIASQIGHIPFNYKKMQWCSHKWEPARLLYPIEPQKLPTVIPAGDLIGTITTTAAAQTGIAAGTPVIACGSDKGCETIGMGVLEESKASLSFGTTATVQTTTTRYFEPIRFMPPYPAPVPGHYNPEIEIFRGYWMITWFKNEFAAKEVALAEKKGIPPEKELDTLLQKAPAGSMGLIVQPYWGPCLKHPSAKGAMIGFGDIHKKEHVYKAVIEGLGYALLDGLHTIEKKSGTRVTQVAVSGGASQSDEICQISSDIFNLPLVRGKTAETSGLGAAIITAKGINVYPDFQSAIDTMVQYDRTFQPDRKNAALYRELYTHGYQKIYAALKPIYENIRHITGYPEQ